ncbi:MAG: DEAD/DEAH box helicase [Vicinamibacterales bacterium]
MPTARQSPPGVGFSALGLSDTLVAALTALGYEEPTPVQRETIPLLIEGRDLLAQAATGTGKTAAFALPMIQRLAGEAAATGSEDGAKAGARRAAAPTGAGRARRANGPAGMVLVPTRELAMQVSEAIHKYAHGSGLTAVPLYGGASMEQQVRALARGANIVVATPGRALDHLRRETLTLESLRLLILDEADEMLDMGFAEDIETIMQAAPAERQTALFSATLPARILRIAERQLTSPARVVVAAEKTASGKLPRVRQVAYVVRRAEKAAALDRILDMENPGSAIVFCRTRLEVDTLVETLNAHGYRAEALHGGMQQRQRDAVMQRVRAGATDLLIATDVAARGLDIERVSHVVNYDLPADPESYVHRIGRTGRAGREGTAITLVDPREHRLLRTIERLTRQRIDVVPVPTVADLQARRLVLTAETLRAHLVANDFDEVRAVVTSLAGEFDVMDIAAAAVKMAHAATAGDGDARTSPIGEGADPAGRDRGAGRGPFVRVFIGAGSRGGIRVADLVGAITGEARVPASAVGAVQIAEQFSIVEVPEDLAEQIIRAVRGTTLRGRKVTVRLDRHT